MWVSKERFEKLENRVKELESDAVATADTRVSGGIFGMWEEPRRIGVAMAISLLAKHLGVQFRAGSTSLPHVEKIKSK
jgi:hypothetical protein